MKNKKSDQLIIDLKHNEVCEFLLKGENYCTIDLPTYICFDDLIKDTHKFLFEKNLTDFSKNLRDYDDVNYKLFNNKDGKYSWRSLQLIHPAIYVSLVHLITEEKNWDFIVNRFKKFRENEKINCVGLPVISSLNKKSKAKQISKWWTAFEQHSINLSLEYDCLIETDITDCYGSIYTHSISWALHSKEEAKKNKKDKNLIGNNIDFLIQDMQHGQTNGLPEGSVLMDFIAEIILGFIDLELSEKIKNEKDKIDDYCILRYRDDYRVFTNNPRDAERLIKLLSEVTVELGLKLSPSKTSLSNDVIKSSIKPAKIAWICQKQSERSLQKHLLIIHNHALAFPNSSSLLEPLTIYYKKILKLEKIKHEAILPLISIIVDIAYRNPRTYPICAAILSKLLSSLETDKREKILNKIDKKFKKIPNTGHMEIWLQRISYPNFPEFIYKEPLCKLISGDKTITIWRNDWITNQALKEAIDPSKIINILRLEKIESIIPAKEIDLFTQNTMYPI